MSPGLVSISFRKLSPEDVVKFAAASGLECIEWGGDVHVPHGDLVAAKRVRDITAEAGLQVAAYGSYLRLTAPDDPEPEAVIETAHELGAPTVRVWAGNQASASATPEFRAEVVRKTLVLADIAQSAHIKVAFEYHGNTLTDTPTSTAQLLRDTAHPAVGCLWQPPNGQPLDTCLSSLEGVLDHLINIHVFHWGSGWKERFRLQEGADRWRRYLARIDQAGLHPAALLEFLPNDDPDLLVDEAATLRHLINETKSSN